MSKRILLVEDDESFGAVLKAYLELNDFHVRWVTDGLKVGEMIRDEEFDLCIFDVMLPRQDGFTIAAEVKMIYKNLPFVFLTAKNMKDDVIRGYQLGAYDYITKPFDSEVLLFKIKVILKQNKGVETVDKKIQLGSFVYNVELRQLQKQSSVIKLSPKEAELLSLLCEYKNQVLSREIALKKIWGDDSYFTTRSMDVYISKLRKYLKPEPNIEIQNIHSSGFRLWEKTS
ncbi:MAG: DNA-binding response regulator [Marinilabiliales bacterium]|nr:MAG: DNA-binding response regulator [Marinilabiliales bacterium]